MTLTRERPDMTIRTDSDIRRLREQGDLTTAEETLIENCRAGEPAMLGDGDVPNGPSDSRTVRADLLRYLITGGCSEWPTQDVGVDLTGAFVIGTLDLKFATAKGETALLACRFENQIEALQSRFEFLDLSGSHLPGLKAVTANVAGSVRLQHTEIKGEVCLGGVRIGGQLDCDNARFLNAGGMALNADSARVHSGVYLRDVKVRGLVTLYGANIGVRLQCERAHFLCANNDLAFNAQDATVDGNMSLNKVTVTGEVRLVGVTVGGSLVCDRAKFSNAGHRALTAFNAQVDGNLSLNNVGVEGEAGVSGARIGGQLQCKNASFSNPCGDALNAQDVIVGGGVFLHSVEAEGQVSLSGARIGGQLECPRAQFGNPNGHALLAQDMTAKGLLWHDVTSVKGRVDLSGAKIDHLMDDKESWDLVEDLVLYGFQYERMHQHISVTFRLEWLLSGAVYDGEFRPQPYEQLARVYKSMGHDADRWRVLIEKERLLRKNERKRLVGFWGRVWWPVKWSWDTLLWFVVGYGYRPVGVIGALSVLWVIGGVMAYQTWHAGHFAPNSYAILSSPEWQVLAEDRGVDNPAEAWSAKHGVGRDWEKFNAAAYAFDVVVPIVTIGQIEAWAPSATRGDWGRIMRWASWFLTAAGWFVGAVGAAAITGIIRRE